MTPLRVIALLGSLAAVASAQEPPSHRPPPARIAIADGIYLFRTAPYGEVGLDGNSVVITSDEGVLVFDTNGTPAAAAAILAEIRRLTPHPVRYVVNSHWHWDHWYGNEVYRDAFPDVKIVAHEKTRALMQGPAIEFNRPGLERELPEYIESLEAKGTLEHLLEDARFFLEQKRRVRHTLPNETFADRMEIRLGKRRVEVLHYGRAVTPGDALLYLPDDKVLVTGDILVNPVSSALSSYPSEWLAALEKMDRLDARVIVPGHGSVLRDRFLIRATMAAFRELLRQGKEMKAKGLDPDQARAAIMPRIAPLMLRITNNDATANRAFELQFVDWFLHRVYDELDGKLTDDIAPIPRH
jgi:cyclase